MQRKSMIHFNFVNNYKKNSLFGGYFERLSKSLAVYRGLLRKLLSQDLLFIHALKCISKNLTEWTSAILEGLEKSIFFKKHFLPSNYCKIFTVLFFPPSFNFTKHILTSIVNPDFCLAKITFCHFYTMLKKKFTKVKIIRLELKYKHFKDMVSLLSLVSRKKTVWTRVRKNVQFQNVQNWPISILP